MRSKRKHQMSHPVTKNHFLSQELLHPYPRPTSDLRVVGNIIRIRQYRLKRKRISVRLRAETGRVRVDQHFLSRETLGLINICISIFSIASLLS
jgi:hypothetical protein